MIYIYKYKIYVKEIVGWIVNFTPHFIMDVIIHPCWVKVTPYLSKGPSVLCQIMCARSPPMEDNFTYLNLLSLANICIKHIKLTDTKITGCACAGNAGNVFPATPTCITSRMLQHIQLIFPTPLICTNYKESELYFGTNNMYHIQVNQTKTLETKAQWE